MNSSYHIIKIIKAERAFRYCSAFMRCESFLGSHNLLLLFRLRGLASDAASLNLGDVCGLAQHTHPSVPFSPLKETGAEFDFGKVQPQTFVRGDEVISAHGVWSFMPFLFPLASARNTCKIPSAHSREASIAPKNKNTGLAREPVFEL